MEILTIVLIVILIVLNCIKLFSKSKIDTTFENSNGEDWVKRLNDMIEKNDKNLRLELNSSSQDNNRHVMELISQNQNNTNHLLETYFSNIDKNITDKISQLSQSNLNSNIQTEKRFNSFSTETEQRLDNIRTSVEHKLVAIQEDNNARLNQIQGIVDQKLQKTLDDKMTQAFSLVNQRLEQVYKGLGEMQSLASNVGDLKKVLTNVKSRGILGELQLGALLSEVLAPSQYIENARVNTCFVEFAIKIPTEDDGCILLPVDSKFPADTFMHLKNALENGDSSEIEIARKNLIARIKSEAKDISQKYISPPLTTDFAIMFLPFEGLYAEAVNSGLIEVLQREYRVSIAGPSTMSALLNSLRLGLQSVAIQKQSDNVWEVLNSVKNEFGKFADALEKTQKKMETASNELNSLVGTRTKMLQKQLNKIGEHSVIE